MLGCFFLAGSSVAYAQDLMQARTMSGVWVGSVKFTSQTTETHVEQGDLKPDASDAATLPGNYDAEMRRLAAEAATI